MRRRQPHSRTNRVIQNGVSLFFAALLLFKAAGVPVSVAREEPAWLWPVPGSYVINALDYYPDGTLHNEGQSLDIGHNGYNGVDRLDVISSTSGVVEKVQTAYGDYHANDGSWGNYVMIKYSDIFIVYAHLKSVSVRPGQRVQAGTVLGKMGTSGNSTGVHLHMQAFPAGATSDNASIKVFDRFKDNEEMAAQFRFAQGLETQSQLYGAWIQSHYQILKGQYYTFSGIYVEETDIQLNHTFVKLQVGETALLRAAVFPLNASDTRVSFASEKETVATVGETGLITAVGTGSAWIYATTVSGRTAKCRVEVTNPFLTFEGKTYMDVKTGDWYAEAVRATLASGLFCGTSDTTFTPDGKMTRGMLAAVLGRMAGAKTIAYKYSRFLDLDMDAYYAEYVVWADKTGIMSGIGRQLFAPDEPVTREQLCAVMVRYYAWAGKALPQTQPLKTFADEADISAWAASDVDLAQQAGFISGRGENCFAPRAYATRAEVATILAKVQNSIS